MWDVPSFMKGTSTRRQPTLNIVEGDYNAFFRKMGSFKAHG